MQPRPRSDAKENCQRTAARENAARRETAASFDSEATTSFATGAAARDDFTCTRSVTSAPLAPSMAAMAQQRNKRQ